MPRRFTSLGRPVDRRYPTNRAIAALSIGVMLVGFFVYAVSGDSPPAALFAAAILGISLFLAWALAREIDPDHDYSAFLAAALSLVPALWLGRPDLAATLLVLLVLRLVNRTVGPAARPADTIGVLILVAVAVWRGHPVLAGASAAAFALDAVLKPPHRIHLAAAGASIGLLAVGVGRHSPTADPGISALVWVALAATAPFLLLVRGSGSPRTVSDEGGDLLSGRRVRAAQCLGLATLIVAVLLEARSGLRALSPLWAAVVGTGLYFSIGAPTRLPHSVHEPS